MGLGQRISFEWASQDDEILIGFYNQAMNAIKVDKDGVPIEGEDPVEFNRFVIGFLLFNIQIFYR